MLSTRDCYEINNHWPLLETNISGHGDIQMDFKRFFFIFYATPGLLVESFSPVSIPFILSLPVVLVIPEKNIYIIIIM